MAVSERPFPDRFSVLPSDIYRFGEPEPDGTPFRIVYERTLPNGTSVAAVNAGLLAFDFSGSAELGSLVVLDFKGSGVVPEAVVENREHVLKVQSDRMQLVAFATACIFASHAFTTNASVRGALFPGLNEIYFWVNAHGQFGIAAPDTPRLARRLFGRFEKPAAIPAEHIQAGLELAARLIESRSTYYFADPVSMVVMTYQAMILHSRQHAGASVALLAVVAEAATKELVYAGGFVSGVDARLPRLSHPTTPPISKAKARDLGFKGAVDLLSAAGVLSPYLVDRLTALRDARNALMHEVADSVPKQSGEGLSVARDLLRLCTGETDFLLTASWTYRF